MALVLLAHGARASYEEVQEQVLQEMLKDGLLPGAIKSEVLNAPPRRPYRRKSTVYENFMRTCKIQASRLPRARRSREMFRKIMKPCQDRYRAYAKKVKSRRSIRRIYEENIPWKILRFSKRHCTLV